ncbi:hypothetical protein MTO96_001536 [Rhipicephalus appendiculatus]
MGMLPGMAPGMAPPGMGCGYFSAGGYGGPATGFGGPPPMMAGGGFDMPMPGGYGGPMMPPYGSAMPGMPSAYSAERFQGGIRKANPASEGLHRRQQAAAQALFEQGFGPATEDKG